MSTTRTPSMTTAFGSVRSLQRGLAILQAVNQHHGMRSAEVAKVVGVPRPTAYRLLETLETLGFVIKGASDETWRPTLYAKTLSSGYRDEDWVVQAAMPEMVKLGRRILWPVDLLTFYDHEMEVRASTHNISPFSVDHGMLGRRLPVMETASGRAYLAFCSDTERRQIIRGLRQKNLLHAGTMMPDGPLAQIIKRTRELGVGYRCSGFNEHTMSISAPIFRDGGPVAALSIIWIASAMTFKSALAEYHEALTNTATTISQHVSVPSPRFESEFD